VSKPSILFILPRFRIISSKTGTDPPTKLVLPPYGTTASFLSLQYFNICETCKVVEGLSKSFDCPVNFRLQS